MNKQIFLLRNLDSVLNAATSDRQIHQISLPTEESVNDLQVTEDVADIICHEESPDAPDQIQSALENNWVDENELKDVESDRWSDNWSTAPQMDTQSVMRVSDSVDNNLSRLEEQQTNEESHQNDWGENDEEEENLVISEGLEEVRNFPVLTDTIEEPPGDNWSIVPEFDDQSVANLTTACPSVASNLNQLDSESGSAHESLQRETDSHSTIMSVVESSFSGPTEDFNGVARRDTQRGNDDWSTMSQAGDRSVIPQLDSIGSNMEKLDSDSWVSWEQTGNPVERLAEAIGYSGVQQFTKEEDEDKEWQEELRTVRSDSISSGAGVGRREAIQRHAASHQNFVRDATEATDHSVPPEDPISENLWISQVPDVAPKPLTLSETSVETEVVAAEQVSKSK